MTDALPSALIACRTGPINARGLTEAACAKLNYRTSVYAGKRCHVANYYDATGQVCAQKLRFEDKSMKWLGHPKRAVLFGQQAWREGGRRVVVTEGEIDAVSVSVAQRNKWPVVSVPNGAQSAKRDLAKNLEWLESYAVIVLMFDEDEPGRAAAAECAELFTPGKVCIAKLPRKDANEMLMAGEEGGIISAAWEANAFRPEGIIAGKALIDEVMREPEHGIDYPWEFLTEKLLGMRTTEIVCWTAGTGIGKSTLIRHVVNTLAESGEHVGVISLEESVREAALGQVSVSMSKPLHLPAVRESVSDDQLRVAAELALERVHFYDHFGSVSADVILPKIRYMVKALGVKWVALDHISIMVSGNATEGDERKRIDELMTKLRTLAQELEIGIHIVVHLRKTQGGGRTHEEGGRVGLQDLRGSGAIGQISNIIIAGERNQQDDDDPNLIVLRGLKNRHSGICGRYGALRYNNATGRLDEAELPDEGKQKGFPARNTTHRGGSETVSDESYAKDEVPF